MTDDTDVIIAGAGIGGLAVALLLARKGLRVIVLERQDPTSRPPTRGEIIQPNGLARLDQLGLRAAVETAGQRTTCFRFLTPGRTSLLTVDYATLPPPYAYACLALTHRSLQPLLDALARESGVTLGWGCEVQGFQRQGGRIAAEAVCHGRLRTVTAPLMIGADGSLSRVREVAGLTAHVHHYQDRYLTMVVKLPPEFGPPRYYLGRRMIFGLFPVSPSELYLFFLVPSETLPHIKAAGLGTLIERLITIEPDLHGAFAELTTWDQVGVMPCVRVRAASWVADGVALLGDAAHAMNPHVSQGRNQALEDAFYLADAVEEGFRKGDHSMKTLQVYEAARRPVVETLQRLADEMVWAWNTGNPLIARIRDHVLRRIDRAPRLKAKVVEAVAGLATDRYTLADYARALGLLPLA